ncbi:hypothetical protein ONZ43_g3032 [Nemania bipapillata]|uniref:Uncharacterized protein n=1 Tax=Nemania bipapillata TaxID=110536 RepID=A0ACC2IY86_9PEZI|nr:hypothetical protein ONZ43_g3032 [Nemania bipapillata]
MADFDEGSLSNQSHALATGFVEKELKNYHPYYRSQAPVRYKQLEPPGTRRVYDVAGSEPRTVDVSTISAKSSKNIPKTMEYWDMIFPSAMKEFQNMDEVKTTKHSDPAYDIRTDTTWNDVYSKFETAQQHYADETGITRRVQRVFKWAAGISAEPVRLVTKVVEQMDIVSPVLAAVQVILDAVKKGAEVRKKVLEGFDELEDVFSDVELFLGIFPKEDLILKLAVSPLVSPKVETLNTTSYLRYFSPVGRGARVIMKGADYEKPLLDNLTTITSRSKKLMAQALKTHTRDFDRYSKATLRILESITNGLSGMEATLALLMDKAEEEAELAKERENRQNIKIRRQEELLREGAQQLGELNYLVRSISPVPPNLTTASRSPYFTSQSETLYINQDDLWNLLDMMDIDAVDMDAIEVKGKHVPNQDRARTEQIVSNQAFQDWIVSPRPSKSMIYGGFSPFHLTTSALSVFCKTLTKAFRSREGYLCLVWFCGFHLGDDDESDIDSSDSEDDINGDLGYVYDEGDDYNLGTRQRVIKRMVRSLIAQLLCDHDFGPRHLLPPDVDPDVIEQGHSLSQLRRLFSWLVRQLPEEITLVCLIDGVSFYEREEFEDPMLDALGDILELATSNVAATVKVLVTSPRPSVTFRVGFEDENAIPDDARGTTTSILSLDSITPSHLDISEERVNRTLGQQDMRFTDEVG